MLDSSRLRANRPVGWNGSWPCWLVGRADRLSRLGETDGSDGGSTVGTECGELTSHFPGTVNWVQMTFAVEAANLLISPDDRWRVPVTRQQAGGNSVWASVAAVGVLFAEGVDSV